MSELKGKQGERFLRNMVKKENRIYCKFCGTKLKKDRFGLICPKDWTHNNEESCKRKKDNSQQIQNSKDGLHPISDTLTIQRTGEIGVEGIKFGEDKTADTNNWTLDKQALTPKRIIGILNKGEVVFREEDVKLFVNKIKDLKVKWESRELENNKEFIKEKNKDKEFWNGVDVCSELIIRDLNKLLELAGKGFSEGKE